MPVNSSGFVAQFDGSHGARERAPIRALRDLETAASSIERDRSQFDILPGTGRRAIEGGHRAGGEGPQAERSGR